MITNDRQFILLYNFAKEYLPKLLGPVFMKRYDLNLAESGYYYGYDSNIDPSISNEFTTAAFRFGHSMVADSLSLLSKDWETVDDNIDMKDALFNPQRHVLKIYLIADG